MRLPRARADFSARRRRRRRAVTILPHGQGESKFAKQVAVDSASGNLRVRVHCVAVYACVYMRTCGRESE